jgi:hypothetical protein
MTDTQQHIYLVDLLDRLLGDGVVIGGDLVRVSLHAVVSSTVVHSDRSTTSSEPD